MHQFYYHYQKERRAIFYVGQMTAVVERILNVVVVINERFLPS